VVGQAGTRVCPLSYLADCRLSSVNSPDNTPSPSAEPEKLVAPLWHTALVLLLMGAMAMRSYYSSGLIAPEHSSRIARYLTTIVIEWTLVGVVIFGIRRTGTTLRQLIGGDWSTSKSFFRDLGIGIVFLIGSFVMLGIVGHVLHAETPASVKGFLPHTLPEKSLWMFLALTAGICEEIITRGYLQRQLTALLKSAPAGIAAQGVIFGLAHVYQGWAHVFIIILLGCMLGILAYWRKSLRPGIIEHFLQDALGGLAGGR